jgi:hypothetical protein
MKQISFLILLLLVAVEVLSQPLSAKIENVRGIVISKYSNNRMGFYCETETQLLYEKDTMLFYQRSATNIDIIKNYPYLKDVIGDYCEYDYNFLFDFSRRIFKHDLTISSYNFHTEEQGAKIVKSLSFYHKKDDSSLYSIYQFYGTVVIYKGQNPFVIQKEDGCFCPQTTIESNHFAVLKEVQTLEPLNAKQVIELGLIKSGIRSIEVFYCE